MADLGDNEAIGATSAGREPQQWWQLLGLGQQEKTEGTRCLQSQLPPQCPLYVPPGPSALEAMGL